MNIDNEMPILIVGKRSKIVSQIKDELFKCEIVSHNDLELIDIAKYKFVFIFSWSYSSLNDNLKLLSKFDLSRVIFISTIAVLACGRRSQWASYPNDKLVCENKILSGGGKVIRIGVWDRSLLEKLPGLVPITSKESLLKVMKDCIRENKQVYWPISLQSGGLEGIRFFVSKFLNNLSLSLPNSKFFQIPLVLIAKLLSCKDYGYTHDSLYFFCNRVLVGYGAVGSAVSKELNSRGMKHSIIASIENNELLVSNGFNGTRLGRFKEGLSKLWHGVWISTDGNGLLRKNVPFFVSRPRLKKGAILGSVVKVDFESPVKSVLISHKLIADFRIFSNIFHFASGVVNNVLIFQKTHKIEAKFSDHEIIILGDVSTEELISRKIVKRRLGLICGRGVLNFKYANVDYLIDFRPKAKNSISIDSENIYNNRVEQIIIKLLKNFSFALINQAVFNKFGMSFDVGKFSVVAQIESTDCISLDFNGNLIRTRLSSELINGIVADVSNEFFSFVESSNKITTDAIHLHGGFDLKDHSDLQEMIDNKRLFIHCNSFDGASLGPFHNTVSMIKKELEIVKNA